MGNLLSCQAPDSCGGKVVLSDGTVHEFDCPTSVAELMLEHPRQFVVDVRSLSAANSKAAPLPADYMLEPDKVYVMLPVARGKAARLSADDARRAQALASRSRLKQRSASAAPFLSVLSARTEAPAEEKGKKAAAFLRQFSSKRWAPTLGTIVEKSMEKKVPHWLL
ncbi:hypothetical protein MUK42_19951 [Musa troglodytarum]|uniref:Uncharacterized protein n=1 Tax=Musa troglodytarum TaxID=320322 RepID=A0A9E7FYX1_9LILI|nr:hypothetical protein MUK42_19951 [Musa troglodytarum]